MKVLVPQWMVLYLILISFFFLYFLTIIFFSFPLVIKGICKLYEQKLRLDNPNRRNFGYDIQALWGYIDSLGDIGALV